MAGSNILLVSESSAAPDRLRDALEDAGLTATVHLTAPADVDTALVRTAVDCLVLPETCGDASAEQLVRASKGLYPSLPVVRYGSDSSRREGVEAVPAAVLDAPELVATVADAVEESETLAGREPSRPETILASMFEQLPVHLYVKNRSRQHVLVNSAMFSPAGLLGQTDEEFLPGREEYLDAARNDDVHVMEEDATVHDIYEYSPAMDKHLRTSKVPWYDDASILGLVGMTTDVTAQKERERLLGQQNERLRKVALLAAHELRNGLQVSTGYLSQVDSQDDPSLGAAQNSLDQLASVVDKVVAMASHEKMAFEPSNLWLSTVVRDVWSAVSLGESTLTITADRRLLADEESIRLFLEILLSNAIEHGGADVSVRVGATEAGFFVADDGPGVRVSPPERVFEAGYASATQNSGFGLYIASRIANEHGWSLSITDSDDGGARFDVTGVERLE